MREALRSEEDLATDDDEGLRSIGGKSVEALRSRGIMAADADEGVRSIGGKRDEEVCSME
jgi:hypothetical protein